MQGLTLLHVGVLCRSTWLGYEDPGGTEKYHMQIILMWWMERLLG